MVEMSALAKKLKNNFENLKAGRVGREAVWREVEDFCDLDDDLLDDQGVSLLAGPSSSSRKVYTGTGILYSKRCAALLVAYMVDPTRPFLAANIESPADVSAGFVTQNAISQVSKEYLGGISWQMHYEQMRPKSGFMTSTSLAMRDFVNYGPAIKFITMNMQGKGRFRHCSVKNCWLAVNEDGEVDTLYRRQYYRLRRLVDLYPKALESKKLKELSEKDKNDNLFVQLVHAVEPRAGGKVGAVKTGKPFGSYFFLPDHDGLVVDEDGFDTFPYSAARNDATEKNPYGRGISEAALPELKVMNHYLGGVETNLDLTNDPPLLYYTGLFDKFSFDAGGMTEIDPTGMYVGNLKDAVMQLPVAGNVSPLVSYLDRLELRIGEFFYTDWMKLRETGAMTATEVNERRDLRLRSMGSLVPSIGPEMFSHEADRLMELKTRRGLLPPPPAELKGREVSMDYDGPLANALKANQVDVLGKMMAAWQGLIKESPEVADIIDIEAVLRNWADGQGAEPGNLRSAEEVAKRQAKREADARAEREQNMLTAQATAMRDGAQGVASLANAGNGRALEAVQQQMAA